jgi:hypothetical protein
VTAAAADDPARWSATAFSVAEGRYSWADVAEFARRDGRWAHLVREAAAGLGWERAGHVADRAAVQRAATEFRYRRRLITAEETETWLRARHLDVGEWMDWVRRSVLAAEHGATAGKAVPGPDIDAVLWSTGRCGGLLDAFAVALAERVAAHLRLTGSLPARDDDVDTAVDRLRAEVVTEAAMRAALETRRLDWLRVETEEGCFGNESAAREAVLSVRDDGVALAMVCELAGAPYRCSRVFLEDSAEELRPLLLGARQGELVGPVATGDGFVVARVESKVVPSVEDPEVRRRAGDAALATALRREVEQRVRWA